MLKLIFIRTFKLVVIVLSFWFIGEKFWEHHNWLRNSAFSLELIITILICSIFYGISEFILSFNWRRLLIFCGHQNISLSLCNSIYGKSQIAKYIPGNIFHVVGRHMLGRQAGIKHVVLAAATIYEILGLVLASLAIGFIGMAIFNLVNIYFNFYEIMGILILTIIISFLFIIAAPLIMKSSKIVLPFNGIWNSVSNISIIYIYYFLFFFIAGLLLIIIVNIFLSIKLIIAAKLIVIFSLAWVAGFIIPGAPGGIGVREVVLIFFLSPIIGEPEGIAVAIALRFVTLLGDIFFFIVSDKKNYSLNK